jgi:hypothetical protein
MKDQYRDLVWSVPPPTAGFRKKVLAAFDDEFGRAPWWQRWPILFVPVAGTLVVLMVISQAFPQTLTTFSAGFRIPYIVEYEFTRYAPDGSPSSESRIASFMNGGDQIILGKVYTGRPFANLVEGLVNSGRVMLLQVAPSLIIPEQTNDSASYWRAYVANGCAPAGAGTVIGHEAVLGHTTTVVLNFSPITGRTTRWLAPDLGCFALKQTYEEPRPDGSFQTRLRVNALSVTVSPAR